jgi:hypothetical protein
MVDIRTYEIAKAIPSLPPSSGELFRRRREIHDAANIWLFNLHVGPILGRDDSIMFNRDEVYVVDHSGVRFRRGYHGYDFPSPIQRIDQFTGVVRGVVVAQMFYREYIIPTQYLLSTTGCFVLGMIKVQRKFRFNRVLRMLGTIHLLPSSLQHLLVVRNLVARFLCGPPAKYKPRPQYIDSDSEEESSCEPHSPQLTSMGWRMLYRQ